MRAAAALAAATKESKRAATAYFSRDIVKFHSIFSESFYIPIAFSVIPYFTIHESRLKFEIWKKKFAKS